MVLLTLGTIIANSWQTSDALKTDSSAEIVAEPTETLYPPQPVRTIYLNIGTVRELYLMVHVGRVAPPRAETHEGDGDGAVNIRQSDAHTWWCADDGIPHSWDRLLDAMALSSCAHVNSPVVGSSQFPWNMATPTHSPLDICVWRYRRVCRFHLFQ